MYVWIYVCVHAFMHACMHVRVFMYVWSPPNCWRPLGHLLIDISKGNQTRNLRMFQTRNPRLRFLPLFQTEILRKSLQQSAPLVKQYVFVSSESAASVSRCFFCVTHFERNHNVTNVNNMKMHADAPKSDFQVATFSLRSQNVENTGLRFPIASAAFPYQDCNRASALPRH